MCARIETVSPKSSYILYVIMISEFGSIDITFESVNVALKW